MNQYTSAPVSKLMVTVVEAGELLGIGRAKAYELAREGVIPTQAYGRQLRVPVGWLLEQGQLDASTLLLTAAPKDT